MSTRERDEIIAQLQSWPHGLFRQNSEETYSLLYYLFYDIPAYYVQLFVLSFFSETV